MRSTLQIVYQEIVNDELVEISLNIKVEVTTWAKTYLLGYTIVCKLRRSIHCWNIFQEFVSHTMARGSEEFCMTPSPGEKVDVSSFLQLHRQRSLSTSNASDSGLDSLMSPIDEEEPMSIVGSPMFPYMRQRSRLISDSESSITSTVWMFILLKT